MGHATVFRGAMPVIHTGRTFYNVSFSDDLFWLRLNLVIPRACGYNKICPAGCKCQLVLAPASNSTLPVAVVKTESTLSKQVTQRLPVKYSAGANLPL